MPRDTWQCSGRPVAWSMRPQAWTSSAREERQGVSAPNRDFRARAQTSGWRRAKPEVLSTTDSKQSASRKVHAPGKRPGWRKAFEGSMPINIIRGKHQENLETRGGPQKGETPYTRGAPMVYRTYRGKYRVGTRHVDRHACSQCVRSVRYRTVTESRSRRLGRTA